MRVVTPGLCVSRETAIFSERLCREITTDGQRVALRRLGVVLIQANRVHAMEHMTFRC